ncbi:alpha-1,2-fucosyltransferase [Sulfuricystis multivorans]|uniref:alpha-1,2-fucosyltransferase n=1 Tax=Sulfuricystis multivorans TaxID=2211108 RepID=UPI000F83C745|nr:alpha-1,2-fucosyltransferase [Sulfuricystis multivorans]
MIIVRLCGGLGNQMFQYAAGLALSLRHGVPLRFDLEWFDRVHLHQGLELDRVFGLDLPRATPSEMRQVLGGFSHPLARRLVVRKRLRWLLPASYALEPYFHYWPGFETLGPNAYLDGYWQSERYFQRHAGSVRAAFRFAVALDERNRTLMEEMAMHESVSVHVRRGDFVQDPVVRRVHGVDLTAYYPQALAVMMGRLRNPHFYVFSDDPEWVRGNLRLSAPLTIVEHNRGKNSYRDMQLMSACRHHVLANSSFSWWGAWLNQWRDKIVVAPKQWFKVRDFDTRDLYSPGWIVL